MNSNGFRVQDLWFNLIWVWYRCGTCEQYQASSWVVSCRSVWFSWSSSSSFLPFGSTASTTSLASCFWSASYILLSLTPSVLDPSRPQCPIPHALSALYLTPSMPYPSRSLCSIPHSHLRSITPSVSTAAAWRMLFPVYWYCAALACQLRTLLRALLPFELHALVLCLQFGCDWLNSSLLSTGTHTSLASHIVHEHRLG